MAGDLIPPPSPAGRPPVDSMEDVRAAAQLEEAAQLARRRRAAASGPAPSPFRGAVRVRARRARRRGGVRGGAGRRARRPRRATAGRRWREELVGLAAATPRR